MSVTVATRTAELVSSEALDRKVGSRVHIERDETKYPSRGTWPQFRGRVGTVVEINQDRKRPHLTEYGVVFGKVRRPNQDGSIAGGAETIWFKLYEIRGIAAQLNADSLAEPHPYRRHFIPCLRQLQRAESTTRNQMALTQGEGRESNHE